MVSCTCFLVQVIPNLNFLEFWGGGVKLAGEGIDY